jgi:hypothetical protein
MFGLASYVYQIKEKENKQIYLHFPAQGKL